MKYGIKITAKNLASGPLRRIDNLVSKMKDTAGGVTARFTAMAAGVGTALTSIVTVGVMAFRKLLGVVTRIVGAIVNIFATMIRTVLGLFTSMVESIGRILGRLTAKIVKVGVVAYGAFQALQVFALKSFAQIEKGWAEVTTIMKMPAEISKQVRETVRDIAEGMGVKAVDAIEAFYQAASQGFDKPKEALHLLRVSIKTSIATLSELPTALSAVTGALNAYGMSAKKAMDVGNIFFIGVRRGKMRLDELYSGLQVAIGAAAMARIKLEELVSFFAVGTQQAQFPIHMLGTGVRALVKALLTPMPKVRKELKRLGLGFKDMRRLGLMGYLQRLQKVARADPEVLARLFPNARALISAILPMTQYFETVLKLADEMKNRGGEIQAAWEIMMNTLSIRWARFWETVKRTAQTFVEPMVDDIGKILDRVGQFLRDNRETVRRWGESYAKGTARIRGYIERMIEFIKGVDWKATWAGLPEALADVAGAFGTLSRLIVQKTGETFKAGPLAEVVLGSLDWLAAEIMAWAREFLNGLVRWMVTDLPAALLGVMATVVEKMKAVVWLFPTPLKLALGGVTEKAFEKSAEKIREMALALRMAGVAAKELDKIMGRPGRRAIAAESRGKAETRIAEGIAGVPGVAGGTRDEMRDALLSIFKVLSEEQKREADASRKFTQEIKTFLTSERIKRAQARIEKRRALLALLKKSDYDEKAAAVEAEVEDMEDELRTYVLNSIALMKQTGRSIEWIKDVLRDHNRMIRRLATARR